VKTCRANWCAPAPITGRIRLYRRLGSRSEQRRKPVPLIAIPYYAWANRGRMRCACGFLWQDNHANCDHRRQLNYRPRYTSLQAIDEAVNWLIEHGVISVE